MENGPFFVLTRADKKAVTQIAVSYYPGFFGYVVSTGHISLPLAGESYCSTAFVAVQGITIQLKCR